MNTDLYTKPVEQLMIEGQISIWFLSGRWTAHRRSDGRGWVEGQGESPREAIIDLDKKLNRQY